MSDIIVKNVKFRIGERAESVSGILMKPTDASLLYVFAHGAGAGMRHTFMQTLAARLAEIGIATFRYQFPFTEAGKKRPDHSKVLTSTVRAAVAKASVLCEGLPIVAGGKSMGGRMTSLAHSEGDLSCIDGLVFVGFPLHPADRPGVHRARHLESIKIPMLFLQGTRDKLADLELMQPVCADLGRGTKLHVVQGADHSFAVLKRSGRDEVEIMRELVERIDDWARRNITGSARKSA